MSKRNIFSAGFVAAVMITLGLFLIGQGTTAFAAKPSGPNNDVIERSNGYPSGPHFNLNVHGKKADYNCDPSPGGNSVFILEYGISTLKYLSNKKSSVRELIAQDRCAEAFDNDPALVQIPYEPEGYYVFATVKAKPQNGQEDRTNDLSLKARTQTPEIGLNVNPARNWIGPYGSRHAEKTFFLQGDCENTGLPSNSVDLGSRRRHLASPRSQLCLPRTA